MMKSDQHVITLGHSAYKRRAPSLSQERFSGITPHRLPDSFDNWERVLLNSKAVLLITTVAVFFFIRWHASK
jgi:hypothetical protein